ncbi:MAG: transcriptional repressor LexA [Spirochaetaceae bacterium]|jgi:repressor LexA|nr:transcriptional repressor LexA [Spirochaetaceae bacterium]
MRDLTRRQQEVLAFITESIAGHAYPPTIRELADHFSMSVKGAYDHVDALKKKGRLKNGGKRSRTMEVVHTGEEDREDSFTNIPILGTVAAGRPILSEENYEGVLPVHNSLLKRKANYFALRVRGDSMVQAGIMEGDLAIIEKRETAQNGEIVVAVVDEAVTLKRFFRESSRIRLQAENPAYSPIYSQDVRVLGKLAGVYRSYGV